MSGERWGGAARRGAARRGGAGWLTRLLATGRQFEFPSLHGKARRQRRVVVVLTEYGPGPAVKPPSVIAAARVVARSVAHIGTLQDPTPQEADGTVPPVPERVVLHNYKFPRETVVVAASTAACKAGKYGNVEVRSSHEGVDVTTGGACVH